MSATWWCSTCQVPLLTRRCERCGATYSRPLARDLVPVFAEEMTILRERLGFPATQGVPVDFYLWASRGTYYRLGVRVASVVYGSHGLPSLVFPARRDLNEPNRGNDVSDSVLVRLLEANKSRIDDLEEEALEFVSETVDKFSGHTPMVTFSGGKDSAVVSELVRKALGGNEVLHAMADTTMETHDTYDYLESFCRANPTVPFIRAYPTVDFRRVCEQIGPPSRIQRWCCTSHKAVPLGTVVSALRSNGSGVLAFDGIRSAESPRRALYSRITMECKIAGEVLASPIRAWTDLEVWTYILTRGLEFNRGYRYGFRRMGCLPCPFNSRWSDYLIGVRYPERKRQWELFLQEHARKVGHPDPSHFSQEGWRARVGGRGMNYRAATVERLVCAERAQTYAYVLSRRWSDSVLEYLKPFGEFQISHDDGWLLSGEIVDVRTRGLVATLRVLRSRDTLKIRFVKTKGVRLALQRFERQLRKYQSCVLCGHCATVCAARAIHVNGGFTIDQKRCTGCQRCVVSSCVAEESLKRKGQDVGWGLCHGTV